MDWSVIYDYRELFYKGVMVTILLTVVATVCGTILGLFISLGKMSGIRILRWICSIYVELFRGTPMLVQILLIHFAIIPSIWGLLFPGENSPEAIYSGFVALSLNAAAYIAEIFRAGIQSIDPGQMEAARSLGMTKGMAMRTIILPQAFTRMLPAFGNEFISLLKDSSLTAVIATPDLNYAAMNVAKSTFERYPPYLTEAAVYLVLTLFLSRVVVRGLEKKYSTR
ncbi:amino acid ABC transporter permease [Brevibacillus invocatus]|uniref:Amino acid ABC transporter permease n=2 Tax=Brevibacillus TaxID=55080 RepID=A0A3M8CMU0_9BACL|nr:MULTISPECIES: amino acid ABC transporter permease [Brevibacillus]RNB71713.1 amino acid ABC transporter permease [Brevibacillus panacihumi]RNB77072.1 amino acid ABC transporter permease [Brevibacillus invocatus]